MSKVRNLIKFDNDSLKWYEMYQEGRKEERKREVEREEEGREEGRKGLLKYTR